LAGLELIESQRGSMAGLLLVGFGIAYAIWGLRRLRSGVERHTEDGGTVAVWALIAIFVLGPCEPLIPLMFVAAARGWQMVAAVSAVFGAITLVMMLGQVLIAHYGLDRLGLANRLRHEHSHVFAGVVIAMTGASVMVLGI